MIASCSKIEPSKILTILDWPAVSIFASYHMKDKLKFLNINCWCLAHFQLYGFNTFISRGINCLKSRGKLTWFLFICWNAYNVMGLWQIASLFHTQTHTFISRRIQALGTNSRETSKQNAVDNSLSVQYFGFSGNFKFLRWSPSVGWSFRTDNSIIPIASVLLYN